MTIDESRRTAPLLFDLEPPSAPTAVRPSWPDGPEDSETIARLKAGDERVFLDLVEQHNAAMVRVASFYVRNDDLAEEVVQETWMALVESLDRFEQRCSLKTWIYRILINRARHRARGEWRLRRRQQQLDSLSSARSDDADISPDDAISDDAVEASPEKQTLASEIRELVGEALASLPSRQRAVFELRDVEGRSASEVQQLLQVSPANERKLLSRARTQVRRLIGPHLGSDH